ncbi:hypothetical protein NA57DRAFT_49976 [Rhizodiscina lignyota]|uniref:Uncharacterized protein n=1 Tax=Rhizodiscina lignyota TaxID=1504668 RepID=A0A9P4I530_9PEZI|nr:hypothetical protein NA57DRAFT_49976 [Rhizodiscina lignyota]
METAELGFANKPEHYIVTIEMFHQLHCLSYLRQRVYEAPGEHFQKESDKSRADHLSHCVDYLRQVLMCHGDVTPIALIADPNPPAFRPPILPNFSIKHTCRKFDKIFDWAAKRNTSGLTIE